jgi:hypothetical protein
LLDNIGYLPAKVYLYNLDKNLDQMRYNAKKTIGAAGPVFVSNAANTPGETTFATFVTDADDGEIAIFGEAGAKITAALAVGTKYFVAQKLAGQIKKTPVFTYTSKQVKAYTAGTKQSSVIAFPAALTAGAEVMLNVLETTAWSHPLPVWDYSTIVASANDFYGTALKLVNQINDVHSLEHNSNGVFLHAKILNSANYAEFDADATFTKGSTAVTTTGNDFTHGGTSTAAVAGDLIYVLGEVYKVASVGTTSIVLDRPYTGETVTIDVSEVSGADSAGVIVIASIGTYSISVQAREYDVTFKLAGYVDTAGVVAALSVTNTAFVKSHGRPEEVLQWEEEGDIWEGYRTLNTAHGADFGKPPSQVVSTTGYTSYIMKFENSQKSVAAPIEKDYHFGTVTIFLGSTSTQWNTQFGL